VSPSSGGRRHRQRRHGALRLSSSIVRPLSNVAEIANGRLFSL